MSGSIAAPCRSRNGASLSRIVSASREQFPADYICEAVDQTRGWFYSLHAISSLVFGSVSFKNVICLGHILDGEGRKMSKSRGNSVDPWDVLDVHGADAFRWYLFASGPPGESRRFSVDLVGEVVKKFWMTLWNTYSFFVTYANLDGWQPGEGAPPLAERPALDRWLLAELAELVERVTKAYEKYDVPGATRPIQQFVDTLSNAYVRMSRRRFWKSDSDADKRAAYATLYETLVTLSKLLRAQHALFERGDLSEFGRTRRSGYGAFSGMAGGRRGLAR